MLVFKDQHLSPLIKPISYLSSQLTFSNLNFSQMNQQIHRLLNNVKEPRLKDVFRNTKIVLGLKQPKSIRQFLVHSRFTKNTDKTPNGLFKCSNKRCKICRLYCEFITSNGTKWEIKSDITCNSKNVIYYLKYNMCKTEIYIGKTNDLRLRTNNHISSCHTGVTPNLFDQHVYKCGNSRDCLEEPYFELYAMMRLNDEAKLLSYEAYLQQKGYMTTKEKTTKIECFYNYNFNYLLMFIYILSP